MPYLCRLLFLSTACFFLIHLVIGIVARVCERPVIRAAGAMPARSAALLLLALRLTPLVLTLALVGLLCIPSYLSLEPHAIIEPIGPWCLCAALLGALICVLSAYRGVRAVVATIRYQRFCQRPASEYMLAGEKACMRVTDAPGPVLALAGIFRPTLLVSSAVLNVLSSEELRSAINHEHAHHASRDNLKRLLILCAPDILPFWNAFSACERAWARFTEWSADDRVVAASAADALSLAAALVQVARLSTASVAIPLATSFLADNGDISARVERLLHRPNSGFVRGHGARLISYAAALICFALLAALATQTSILRAIHEVLERLMR